MVVQILSLFKHVNMSTVYQLLSVIDGAFCQGKKKMHYMFSVGISAAACGLFVSLFLLVAEDQE